MLLAIADKSASALENMQISSSDCKHNRSPIIIPQNKTSVAQYGVSSSGQYEECKDKHKKTV